MHELLAYHSKIAQKKYNKRQSIHCSILFAVITNENKLLPDVAVYKEGWDSTSAWWPMVALHSSPQGLIRRSPGDLTRESKLEKCSPVSAPYGYDHPVLRNYCCQYHPWNKELAAQFWALSAQAMDKHSKKTETVGEAVYKLNTG